MKPRKKTEREWRMEDAALRDDIRCADNAVLDAADAWIEADRAHAASEALAARVREASTARERWREHVRAHAAAKDGAA